MITLPRASFNGGELSDWLHLRPELQKHTSGVKVALNTSLTRYGPARRRAGFLAGAQTKAADVRIEGFNFSRTHGLVLEFTNLALRFWLNDGSQIESGGSPYEIVTPWTTADLANLDFSQKNNLIVVTDGRNPAQVLTRAADDDWTIAELPWKNRPWRDLNDTTTTLTASLPAAQHLLTASAALFTSDWVGSHIRLDQNTEAVTEETSLYRIWYPDLFDGSYVVANRLETFVKTSDYLVAAGVLNRGESSLMKLEHSSTPSTVASQITMAPLTPASPPILRTIRLSLSAESLPSIPWK